MERSEERRGTRQVALRLCDTPFYCEDVHIARYDIENLIKNGSLPVSVIEWILLDDPTGLQTTMK